MLSNRLPDRVSPVAPDLRARLADLEAAIVAELPLVDLPIRHFWIPGVYVREMTIPAGTVLTGKIHKHEQVSIVAKGDISVLTEDGIKRVQAPFVLVSPPGVKRAGFAHEDTIWMTVHRYDDEQTPERVEGVLVCNTFEEFERFALEQKEAPCLLQR
jgi:hypothetical protein